MYGNETGNIWDLNPVQGETSRIMKAGDKYNTLIGITALATMIGVAWTFYHYNMQNKYAEVRCEQTQKKHGIQSAAYRSCMEREKAMFSAKKSNEGRREISEYESSTTNTGSVSQ